MDQSPVLEKAAEAHVGGVQDEVQFNRKLGFWLFLSSELLIFCGLIGGFLVTKHYATTWPTWEQLSIPLATVNTFLLLTSSLTLVSGWTASGPATSGAWSSYSSSPPSWA